MERRWGCSAAACFPPVTRTPFSPQRDDANYKPKKKKKRSKQKNFKKDNRPEHLVRE